MSVFTRSGNTEQNQLFWGTSYTVGLPKQSSSYQNRLLWFSVFSLFLVSIEKIYQTLKILFDNISEHLKVSQKYYVSYRQLSCRSNMVFPIWYFTFLTHLEVPQLRMAHHLHYKIALCYTSLWRHCNFWRNQVFVKLLYLMWHPHDIHSLGENLG